MRTNTFAVFYRAKRSHSYLPASPRRNGYPLPWESSARSWNRTHPAPRLSQPPTKKPSETPAPLPSPLDGLTRIASDEFVDIQAEEQAEKLFNETLDRIYDRATSAPFTDPVAIVDEVSATADKYWVLAEQEELAEEFELSAVYCRVAEMLGEYADNMEAQVQGKNVIALPGEAPDLRDDSDSACSKEARAIADRVFDACYDAAPEDVHPLHLAAAFEAEQQKILFQSFRHEAAGRSSDAITYAWAAHLVGYEIAQLHSIATGTLDPYDES